MTWKLAVSSGYPLGGRTNLVTGGETEFPTGAAGTILVKDHPGGPATLPIYPNLANRGCGLNHWDRGQPQAWSVGVPFHESWGIKVALEPPLIV
jgi:hypothetical protein